MVEEIFVRASSKFISDYDYVPKRISEEQKEICERCSYRTYYLEKDIAMVEAKRRRRSLVDCFILELLEPPIPKCEEETCLIDGKNLRTTYIKRLLRQNRPNTLKRMEG